MQLSILPSQLLSVVAALSGTFLLGLVLTPFFTDFLFKHRIGKRLRQNGVDGKAAPIFTKLHADKAGTPKMGGLIFWVTTALVTLIFNLDRAETFVPLATLVAAGLVGAADDLMNVLGKGPNGGGIRLRDRLPIYVGIAAIGAWWFFSKLDWSTIYLPFNLFGLEAGLIDIGLWYPVLFVVAVTFFSFSMNQTDGLDGLAGGVSAFACFVFMLLALVQGKTELAIFCGTLAGSLLAFLWFNVHPARFFMGDTGSMALGMVLPILAFLTNSVLVLPLILIIPLVEGLSTILQILSKRFLKRKIFRVAPIHHHFEAIGWPETKVTMRFWIISAIGGSLGLLVMMSGVASL